MKKRQIYFENLYIHICLCHRFKILWSKLFFMFAFVYLICTVQTATLNVCKCFFESEMLILDLWYFALLTAFSATAVVWAYAIIDLNKTMVY